MFWKNQFFTADFTPFAAFLSSIETGYVFEGENASLLAGELENRDPHPATKVKWEASERESSFNTVGMSVVYNGHNNEFLPTNGKYTHVMVLQINEAEVPDNKIYLHYDLLT